MNKIVTSLRGYGISNCLLYRMIPGLVVRLISIVYHRRKSDIDYIRVLSQEEYDNIEVKDIRTLYIIKKKEEKEIEMSDKDRISKVTLDNGQLMYVVGDIAHADFDAKRALDEGVISRRNTTEYRFVFTIGVKLRLVYIRRRPHWERERN